jgi:hypothetical protein
MISAYPKTAPKAIHFRLFDGGSRIGGNRPERESNLLQAGGGCFLSFSGALSYLVMMVVSPSTTRATQLIPLVRISMELATSEA